MTMTRQRIVRNSPEHQAAYAEIGRLHAEYQQCYSDAAWRAGNAIREAEFKAGRVHRDGRPVDLNNGGLAELAAGDLDIARLALEQARQQFDEQYELV